MPTAMVGPDIRSLLPLLACCWLAAAPAATGQPALVESVSKERAPVIDWSQEVFVIPYQWSSQRDPELAKEVILYVAAGDGTRWSEVTRASPRVRSFRYRAPSDGRYAFAVRTLDTQGRLWPKGGLSPELLVRVDTQIPQLKLSGSVDGSGAVVVRCDVTEANLDTSATKIEARTAGGEWQPLSHTAGLSGVPGTVRLEARWQSPDPQPAVELRVEVKDRAGNPAVATVVAEAVAAGLSPAAVSMNGSSPAATSPAVEAIAAESSDPFLQAPPIELPPAGNWASPAAPSPANSPPLAATPVAQSTPASTPQQSPSTPSPAHSLAAAGDEWVADATSSTPFDAASPNTWRSAPGGRESIPRVAAAPVARQAAPPTEPRAMVFDAPSLDRSPYHLASTGLRSPMPSVESTASQTPRSTATTAGPVMFVNQATFALDYQLQQVDRWGVSRVEVWGTDNGGRTWRKYAIDSDQQSPVTIATPGAGRYGFRVVVQGVSGLPQQPPRPGDRPEMTVVVDVEPPTVQLISARQGEGYLGNQLIVRWRADDASLADRPISLWFSHRPDGPWSPIASELENTGEYAWRLRRHLPRELFVKLQAKDQAGNTTAAQNDVPAPLNFASPSATLHGARAIGQ
ncbi:MAG: hypothetical protein AAGJ46_14580 [Planctomycetota bacterium]